MIRLNKKTCRGFTHTKVTISGNHNCTVSGRRLLFFDDFAPYDRLGLDGGSASDVRWPLLLQLLLAPAEFDLSLNADRLIFATSESFPSGPSATVTPTVSDGQLLSYSLDLARKSGDRDRAGSICVCVGNVGVILFRNAIVTGSVGCDRVSDHSFSSSDSLLRGIM